MLHPLNGDELIIFSVDKPGIGPLATIKRREQLRARLTEKEIEYRALDGRYGGVDEAAFMIRKGDWETIRTWPHIAQQESVLWLSPVTENGQRNAGLFFGNGKGDLLHYSSLGVLREISAQLASKTTAYFHDAGRYYVAS